MANYLNSLDAHMIVDVLKVAPTNVLNTHSFFSVQDIIGYGQRRGGEGGSQNEGRVEEARLPTRGDEEGPRHTMCAGEKDFPPSACSARFS